MAAGTQNPPPPPRPRGDPESSGALGGNNNNNNDDYWESALEPTMISDQLTFDEKMRVIDAWFEARPLEVVSRLAEVGRSGGGCGGGGYGGLRACLVATCMLTLQVKN